MSGLREKSQYLIHAQVFMLPVAYMYFTNTYQQHSDDVIYPTQQGWEMEMAIGY